MSTFLFGSKLVLVFCYFMYIFFIPHITKAASDSPKILVVHSYHKSQKGHVVEMTYGIKEALAACKPKLLFFHMDTKRHTSLSWKKKAGEKANLLMQSFKPDVVIAMDDNAQQYFVKHHADEKKGPAFVFGGVNNPPENYGFPAANVTGVIERPNIKESIDFLLKLTPTVKTIVLLSDKSPTTKSFHNDAVKLNLPVRIIATKQVETLDEWEQVIQKYRTLTDAFGIYVIRTIKNKQTGRMATEGALIARLNALTRKPTVGFFDSAAKAGILCGISVSMTEQGYSAGEIACKIIKGAKPYEIPIQNTKRGRMLINLSTAKSLDLMIPYTIIRMADEIVKD